jgi:hypothetical protein
MSRKRLIIVTLSLVLVAIVIGLTRRHPASFSVRLGYYDPTAQSASIIISNETESDLRFGFWQKGPNTAKVYSRLTPHQTEEMILLLDKNYPPEVCFEGTLTTYRSVFWKRLPFLGRLGFYTSSESAMSLHLTNGSGR